MLTLAYKQSRSAFAHRKAPEGWRTPNALRIFRNQRIAHGVLDCGGPPPLFPKPHPIVPILPQLPLEYAAPDGAFYFIWLNYKDVAPTALNAAFFWIQEHAGQKLKRKIQSQRLNETGCKQRRLLTVGVIR